MSRAEDIKSYVLKMNNEKKIKMLESFILGLLSQEEIEQEEERQIANEAEEIIRGIKENNANKDVIELANELTDDTKWLIVQLIKKEQDISFQDDYNEFVKNSSLEEIFVKFSTLTNDSITMILELFGMLLTIKNSVNKEH